MHAGECTAPNRHGEQRRPSQGNLPRTRRGRADRAGGRARLDLESTRRLSALGSAPLPRLAQRETGGRRSRRARVRNPRPVRKSRREKAVVDPTGTPADAGRRRTAVHGGVVMAARLLDRTTLRQAASISFFVALPLFSLASMYRSHFADAGGFFHLPV